MATVNQQSVDTGNTIYIMANNQIVGRAQSLNGERSYGTEAVHEIGSIMPQEHVYLRFEGSITLSRFRIKQASLDQIGLGALGEDILQRGVIDIAIVDNLTKSLIIAYRGCTATTLSETFAVGEIAGEEITMQFLSSNRVAA